MFFFSEVFPFMFMFVFIFVFGIIIVTVARSLKQWNTNNHSPRLTVNAELVTKRTQVGHHHHSGANGMHHSNTYTVYFATFQVESGDRIELAVSSEEYGMLVEHDYGSLTFQGTRFLSFERR